jgi:hypothetical protein
MNEQIFFSIPLESFKDVIKATVFEALNSNQKIEEQDTKDKFLTRQETAKLLHISLTTLDTYTRLDLIKRYKVGNRVLYKKSDINDSLLEKISSIKFKSK